jgi:hypothetical protein
MRKFASDYEVITVQDEQGRDKQTAVYRGPFYQLIEDELSLLEFRRKSYFLLAIIIIFHVAGGFISNEGMNQFYVVLPYVFSFFPMYYLVAGSFSLPKEKRDFRRDEVALSFDRIEKACLFLLILLCLVVVGEIVFLLGFSQDGRLLEYLFTLLEVFAVCTAFIWFRTRQTLHVHLIDNQG